VYARLLADSGIDNDIFNQVSNMASQYRGLYSHKNFTNIEVREKKNVPNANQTNYRVQIPVNQIVNANLFLHGMTAGNDVKD